MFAPGDKVKCIDPSGPLVGGLFYYVRRLCTEDTTMMEVSEKPHGPPVPRNGTYPDTRDAWNMSRFAPVNELRLDDVRYVRGVWRMRDHPKDQEVMVTDGLGNAWHGAHGEYCCEAQYDHVLEPTTLRVEQFMKYAPEVPPPATPAQKKPRIKIRCHRLLLV